MMSSHLLRRQTQFAFSALTAYGDSQRRRSPFGGRRRCINGSSSHLFSFAETMA